MLLCGARYWVAFFAVVTIRDSIKININYKFSVFIINSAASDAPREARLCQRRAAGDRGKLY